MVSCPQCGGDKATALEDVGSNILWRVFALETRADVLREIGRTFEAEQALEQALALQLQKGDVLSSERIRPGL